MKKLIFTLALLTSFVAPPIASHAQMMQPATSFNFQNITTNSATMMFASGSDSLGAMIQNRQQIKIKYRAVPPNGGDPSAQVINGTETEIPLIYTINSPTPLQPITLSGLQANQRYAVWIGQQAIQQCISTEPCIAIYIKYNAQPFFFSTKLDTSKIVTLTKNLLFQAKSSDVVILKKYLSAHNYMSVSTSKTFDIATLVGVIKFQIANNLMTDGTIGSGSRSIINQWLLQVAQN